MEQKSSSSIKLNVFLVPYRNLTWLKTKFDSVGLESLHNGEQGDWTTTFYFSRSQKPSSIPWVETFAEFFEDEDHKPANVAYYGAYLFEKPEHCYVMTFGKSHFYVRPFCDHDFGIEVAKRIADEGDIKQTSSKRHAGRKKKEIKSYTSNTRLSVESGESVDFLSADIVDEFNDLFGSTAKFGSSVLLAARVDKDRIYDLLDGFDRVLADDARFNLPRTSVVTEDEAITRYDQKLIEAIRSGQELAGFTHSGHDIVGVDFVFSGHERYTLTCSRHKPRDLGNQELDLEALRSYIDAERLADFEILNFVRVKVANEGQREYSKKLKESLDFLIDGENVMLTNGKWVRFNDDYIDQLNTYIDSIHLEETEHSLREIRTIEGEFNDSQAVRDEGYTNADKVFSNIKTRMPTQVEAWDLYKEGTVYAVKVGKAQKLHYACDQATAVLEILRNNANVKKLPMPVERYCLWLGVVTNAVPTPVSSINSLILKQKLDAWARKCWELGIEPRLKFSLRRK